jgi:hypothetical protein
MRTYTRQLQRRHVRAFPSRPGHAVSRRKYNRETPFKPASFETQVSA